MSENGTQDEIFEPKVTDAALDEEDDKNEGKKTKKVDKAIGRSRSRSRSCSRSRCRHKHSRHHYSSSRSRTRSRSRSRRHRRRRHSRSRSYERRHRHSRYREGRSHSRSPMSSRRRHRGNRENPAENKSLGVFGLSLYTTERDLRDVFEHYGPLESVNVVYDHQTGRSRGFAFVLFSNVDDAMEARSSTNGIEVDGRRIRVDYSITERAHTPTPGVYMGKPTRPRRDSFKERGGGGGPYYRSPSPYYRRTPSPHYYRRSPSPMYYHRRSPSPYYRHHRRHRYAFSPSRY